eukprot:11205719-Lingulodinium_polyedra.AAC.1
MRWSAWPLWSAEASVPNAAPVFAARLYLGLERRSCRVRVCCWHLHAPTVVQALGVCWFRTMYGVDSRNGFR